MAFGDSSALLTPQDVFLLNQTAASEAAFIWRRGSIFATMALGEKAGFEEDGFPKFSQTAYLKGRNIEVDFHGVSREMYGVDDSEQFDDDTLAEPGGFAAQEFKIAHYEDKIGIGKEKLVLFQDAGKQQKLNYLNEIYRLAEEARLRTIQKAVNETVDTKTAPARKYLGSWVHAISDGLGTDGAAGTNYKLYGTIDRSVAGNEDFRPAKINLATGNLTRSEIGKGQLAVQANGGMMDCGWAGVDVMQRLRDLFEGFLDAKVSDRYVEFGGDRIRYAGTTFGLEAFAPAGMLGAGDSRGWKTWLKKAPITREGVIYVPTKKAAYILPYDLFVQIICTRVQHQCKWTGINA